ncbi:AAA family ATPase [Rhizobium sp. BK491]|uniref:AAA family ATPase n=1 Tax=Rhizobium sp. BK491 TaxID=2587009 RepID=UPI001812B15A|nr:AAA family ATPase [Rhizobium sp. BK491]MBB3567126.1 adenylate kinase family enzyme [Rhizobium sp. BK491]
MKAPACQENGGGGGGEITVFEGVWLGFNLHVNGAMMKIRHASVDKVVRFGHWKPSQFFDRCPMLPLHSLGERIVVLGPSNAGKSTLAVALSKKLGFPTIHLDQLHHLPHTDWQQRPEAEFAALHDAAILRDQWIMEGNYTRLMPQRLARATGAILITSNHWLRFSRYLKRTLINRSDRAGHLEGAKDSIKWEMIHWILVKTRKSGVKYAKILQDSELPMVECRTAKALNNLYQAWDLPRSR